MHDEENGDVAIRLCQLMSGRLKSPAVIVSLIVERQFIVERTLAR